MINETMARRYWPEGDPLGQRLKSSGEGSGYEIIGVVKDSSYYSLGEVPIPYAYLSFGQNSRGFGTIHLRITGSATKLQSAVRREILEVDSRLDGPPSGDVCRAEGGQPLSSADAGYGDWFFCHAGAAVDHGWALRSGVLFGEPANPGDRGEDRVGSGAEARFCNWW